MATERIQKTDFASIEPGLLLDWISMQFKASDPIENVGTRGRIKGSNDQSGGPRPAGLTKFRLGFHSNQDLDIRASFANKKALATERRALHKPRSLHMLAEYGDRYKGAVGRYSLAALTRLTVALCCEAALNFGSAAKMTFVADKNKPLHIDSIADKVDSLDILRSYDKYIQSSAKKIPKKAKDSKNALAEGLKYLNPQDEVQTESDICIVMSDFLMGAKRGKDGQVIGFNWQAPLYDLAEKMDDRLYLMHLSTPSQLNFPNATTLLNEGRPMQLDLAEYLDMNQSYHEGATQKQERLRAILRGFNFMEVSTLSNRPVDEISNFLFDS